MNLARTPGLHPYSSREVHGVFNDHRESGPRFNVSSEKWKDHNNTELLVME